MNTRSDIGVIEKNSNELWIIIENTKHNISKTPRKMISFNYLLLDHTQLDRVAS